MSYLHFKSKFAQKQLQKVFISDQHCHSYNEHFYAVNAESMLTDFVVNIFFLV